MKTKTSILTILVALVTIFSSCVQDDKPSPQITESNSYIINYGNYSGDKGGISLYSLTDSAVTNDYFESVNGISSVSNIQYAYQVYGKVYFMGNNADQVFWVDEKTFVQTENGISGTDLVKPRYCVAEGNTLYVSCWGGEVWSDPTVSYITKIDLTVNTVIGKIELPGGPEGLAIANGKLYAALNYDKKIAVIELSSENITYIDAPAVSSYFVKDENNNLYVSFMNSYSIASDKEGIGLINTNTDQLTVYELSGISASYVNMMELNSDFSKLYVMTSAYDENWNLSGAISVFNTNTKTFEANPLVTGVSGLNGISVDKFSGDIYYFVAENATSNGKMLAIKPDGSFIKEYETGISPYMMLSLINSTND